MKFAKTLLGSLPVFNASSIWPVNVAPRSDNNFTISEIPQEYSNITISAPPQRNLCASYGFLWNTLPELQLIARSLQAWTDDIVLLRRSPNASERNYATHVYLRSVDVPEDMYNLLKLIELSLFYLKQESFLADRLGHSGFSWLKRLNSEELSRLTQYCVKNGGGCLNVQRDEVNWVLARALDEAQAWVNLTEIVTASKREVDNINYYVSQLASHFETERTFRRQAHESTEELDRLNWDLVKAIMWLQESPIRTGFQNPRKESLEWRAYIIETRNMTPSPARAQASVRIACMLAEVGQRLPRG